MKAGKGQSNLATLSPRLLDTRPGYGNFPFPFAGLFSAHWSCALISIRFALTVCVSTLKYQLTVIIATFFSSLTHITLLRCVCTDFFSLIIFIISTVKKRFTWHKAKLGTLNICFSVKIVSTKCDIDLYSDLPPALVSGWKNFRT